MFNSRVAVKKKKSTGDEQTVRSCALVKVKEKAGKSLGDSLLAEAKKIKATF